MQASVILMDQGPKSGPLTPDSLAEAHPAWADDTARCGPFTPQKRELVSGHPQRVWIAPSEGADLFVAGRVESALDVAWELSKAGLLQPWSGVLAVEQTSGRGQLRRPWQSPPGNLHLALRLPELDESVETERLWSRLLPLVLGYCLARALEDLGSGSIGQKWPNDLVQNGRKVGGMLLEQRGGRTILGLGLNLRHAPPREQMRLDAAIPASVLDFSGHPPGPMTLCRRLVKITKNYYEFVLEDSTPHGFPALASQRMLWMGRTIFWKENEKISRVRLLRIASDGGLVVDRAGREETIYSGSISPERPDNFLDMSPVNDGAN